jgi:hypothetical protein
MATKRQFNATEMAHQDEIFKTVGREPTNYGADINDADKHESWMTSKLSDNSTLTTHHDHKTGKITHSYEQPKNKNFKVESDGPHSVEFYDARERKSKAAWHYANAGKRRGASLSKGIKNDYEAELLKRGVKDSNGKQLPLRKEGEIDEAGRNRYAVHYDGDEIENIVHGGSKRQVIKQTKRNLGGKLPKGHRIGYGKGRVDDGPDEKGEKDMTNKFRKEETDLDEAGYVSKSTLEKYRAKAKAKFREKGGINAALDKQDKELVAKAKEMGKHNPMRAEALVDAVMMNDTIEDASLYIEPIEERCNAIVTEIKAELAKQIFDFTEDVDKETKKRMKLGYSKGGLSLAQRYDAQTKLRHEKEQKKNKSKGK